VAQKRQKRTLDCRPKFVNGYAEGWHMAVPEAFKDELDIKYTERVENGQKLKRWTQGIPPVYAFKEGHIFYYNPEGYSVGLAAHVQIDTAIPDRFDPNEGHVRGYVFVKFFLPNRNKTGIEQTESARLTQANFVHFLRTGEMKKMPSIHPEFQ
jgi:hypothetical protein